MVSRFTMEMVYLVVRREFPFSHLQCLVPSWTLKDGSSQIILSSGEGYDTSNSLNTVKQCLIPGRYTFSIFDSFGDGLCCGHGNGYYKLKSNGAVIHSGAEFASQ